MFLYEVKHTKATKTNIIWNISNIIYIWLEIQIKVGWNIYRKLFKMSWEIKKLKHSKEILVTHEPRYITKKDQTVTKVINIWTIYLERYNLSKAAKSHNKTYNTEYFSACDRFGYSVLIFVCLIWNKQTGLQHLW